MNKNRLVITSVIILLVLFCLIPIVGIRAASEDDFAVSEGVLTKYNGSDTSIEIPMGVRAIGPGAFEGSGIETVTIPDYIEIIGDAAFHNCKNLREVNIKSGVNSIGNSAFASCDKLSIANIPDSVNRLGYGVFADDTSLKSISLGPDSKFFFNDGALYNKDSTELIQYLSGSQALDYEMPFSVKNIYKYAFWGADNLEYIRVSNNVSFIPAYAFSGCHALKCVLLPESVKRVDDYAFYNCDNLGNVIAEQSDIKIAKTATVGATNASVDKGISADASDLIVKNIKNSRVDDTESMDVESQPKLSGAIGVIHNGSVSIFDLIDDDKENEYTRLEGEIGSAKTNDGNVNVFFDEKSENIGTITVEKAEEREKQRQKAIEEKRLAEIKKKEEQKAALIEKMDNARKDAFKNWKNN